MKTEDFKNMVREMIRTELKSIMHPSKDHQDPHKDPHLAHEEICEGEGCLDEKSVPEPYNRKAASPMSRSQIERRKKIGQSMIDNEKIVAQFKKDYGDDWKSYIWRSATSAAFREK